MAKTLEQLKLENAALETEQQQEAETVIPETIVEEEVIEQTEDNADDDGEQVGEPEEAAPLEDWMQSEDQTSHDNETVPVGVLAKVRGKLKGKLHERDDEIERLTNEINQLKQGSQQPVVNQQPQVAARPKREDFYDQDDPDLAYDLAVDGWQDKRFEARQAQSQQTNQATQQQQQQMSQVKTASDAHYQRAEKLVGEGKITAESYVKADNAVRGVLEQVYPGNGDQTTDMLISQLSSVGDGSEKVMYYLGNNPTALNTLRDKLSNDKSGLQAMVYLGSLMGKGAQAPSKKISQAPRPATRLQGDDNSKDVSKPMQKKYKAAHTAKDSQTAFNIKREARAAGIDTSNW